MTETASVATKEILSWIPKKYRPYIAVSILIIVLLVAGWYVYGNYIKPNISSKCDLVNLKGSILDKTVNKKLVNVKVELENSSTTVDSYTTPDGSFILEGIKLPNSRLISLLVTLVDGRAIHVKDLDLNNTKYTIGPNCVIDLKTINIVYPKNQEEKTSNSSDEKKSKNPALTNLNRNERLIDYKKENKVISGKIKITILPFEFISNASTYNSLSRGIPESLTGLLAANQKYIIIEGLQRDKVLNEINFQQGKYVDVNSAVRIGKILGAEKVIIGSCQILNDRVEMTARVVDVESGVIVNSSIVKLIGLTNNILEVQDEFVEKMSIKLNEI